MNKSDYVVVIGGANVDIVGVPDDRLVKHDSAPGRLKISGGGVARNVAENLARMGVSVKLLTAFGNDANGDMLKRTLVESGVDLSQSITTSDFGTSTYIALNSKDGEMQVGFADMRILSCLDREFFERRMSTINGAAAVVLDTNLFDIFPYLATAIQPPCFLDTVSTQKATKCKDYIKGFALVKPNMVEAAAILDEDVTADNVSQCAKKLLAMGNKRVVVTMGEDGVYFDDGEDCGFLPILKGEVVSTTGAGDAMLAAIVLGSLQGMDLRSCVQLGLGASAITVASESTVNKEMNRTTLFQRCAKEE